MLVYHAYSTKIRMLPTCPLGQCHLALPGGIGSEGKTVQEVQWRGWCKRNDNSYYISFLILPESSLRVPRSQVGTSSSQHVKPISKE